jgi:KaiC/GvpD/RAD55 family RecA-like ATPase
MDEIQQGETNFSSFGKQFQEKLAYLIMQDPIFANQIGEVLDYNFFELKYLRVFAKKIFDYKTKYGKYASQATVETILRSEMDDENEALQKQIREFYARFASGATGVDDEYVKSNSVEFCKKQKLKEAMIKSVELLKQSSFEEIRQLIDNAIKLGTNSDFGYSYDEHFEQRYELKARKVVTTGWDVFDGFMRGGLGRGELGVVVAPTGAGKSFVLVHLGAQAVKAGKTVLHYTLELDDKSIGLRYDSAITGIPLDALQAKKDVVFEKIKDVTGKLIIKEYPTKSASTSTIRNHLEKIRQRGIDVGMIILDYGDLLKPSTSRKEKREELESIYEELRGLAKETGCPIWTASQTNRSGLNAEVITLDSISEAFNKCFVADFIFTVSRTLDDKKTNSGRMLIAKNRFGPDGIICPIFMDTSCAEIRVFEPTNESKEDIEKKASKKQLNKLKEKYVQFKSDVTVSKPPESVAT